MKIKSLFTGLFLMWGLSGAFAQISLSFNPERGAKYEYQTDMSQNAKQSVMGQEIPMVMEQSIKYLMEITEKTAQEITARITYNEMTFSMSNPMMRVEYDSKKPVESHTGMVDPIFAKMFGAMMGQSLTAVFSPDGSVKSVTGMEAIGERMINAIAGENPMFAQMGEQMKQQFNDDAMSSTFEQSFKIYPANRVNVGTSWNVDGSTMVNNMNTGYKNKYTLKEVNNNMAIIAVEGEIEMNPGAGVDGKITGTQTGTFTIDTRTGMPTTSEISQNSKGSIRQGVMDIQMEIVSNTKTSIISVN